MSAQSPSRHVDRQCYSADCGWGQVPGVLAPPSLANPALPSARVARCSVNNVVYNNLSVKRAISTINSRSTVNSRHLSQRRP